MPAGVGVGGTLLLLGLAFVAAYFNARADYEEGELALLKKNTPPILTATGDLNVSAAAPAPVEEAEVASPSPPPPLAATPAFEPPPAIREQKVESPEPTPPPVIVPSSPVSVPSSPTSKAPFPPVEVPTKAAASLPPAFIPEPVRAAPATSSSRRWFLSIISTLLVVLGGAVAAIALFLQANPSYPPPADAGAAFAAALAKLPRTRLPVSSSSVRPDSDAQRDKGLVPSQHRSKILSPGSQPAFLTSPLPKSNSVSFTSQATSPAVLPSTSSPAVTPISFVREPSQEVPPVPAQPPPPVPVPVPEEPPHLAQQRSDLAFSSSRFMMSLVGKGTPQKVDSPSTTMRTEESQPKTWKWRENEAKRKEEAARTLTRDTSADALPSLQTSQPAQTPTKASNGESGVISTPQSPIAAEGSEDGARKEEARLARSMSKKGISLSKGSGGV